MIVHTHKVMPILSSVLVLIGFSDRVWRDQPRDVPEVDPDTQGQENIISMSTDESIGITFCVWTIITWGGHSYTRHP